MYQVLAWRRIKKLLEPVWYFRPSSRALLFGGSTILVCTIIVGATFLDDILLSIETRNSTYEASEAGDVLAPAFGTNLEWSDGKTHRLNENNGKVSVIHFWSASCVTCQDVYGFMRKLHDQYSSEGVNVYGVYAPQFDFEVDNLEVFNKTLTTYDMGRYPLAVDRDFELNKSYYEVAESFGSNGSIVVVVDQEGYIRHIMPDGINLVNTELLVQGLLYEAGVERTFAIPTGKRNTSSSVVNLYFNDSDTQTTGSFIADEKLKDGKQTYTLADELFVGQWTLGGTWDRDDQALQALSNGTFSTQITGKRVFIVVSTENKNDYVGISVNGETKKHRAPGVGKDGILEVTSSGVYQIIAAKESLNNAQLDIAIPDGMKLYQVVVLPQ